MTKFYDTQKRAIILLAVSLVVGGVFSWNQMPKRRGSTLSQSIRRRDSDLSRGRRGGG